MKWRQGQLPVPAPGLTSCAASTGYRSIRSGPGSSAGSDRETGEEALAVLRQAPGIPLARVFVPLVHALLGDRDLARATFEEFRHMPGTVEIAPRWTALLVYIGHVALLLDDTETADRVYQELSGLAPFYLADGSGAVFCGGSGQRVVADLALATGRVDEAITGYTEAIEMNARIGAPARCLPGNPRWPR